LRQVDGVRRRRGESRSQYFRDAADARLRSETESAVEVYRRGYVDRPESAGEVEAATKSAVALLASEPWE
jgi:predicted DNA-binding WGR domain protein